jgi:hypothetical protein
MACKKCCQAFLILSQKKEKISEEEGYERRRGNGWPRGGCSTAKAFTFHPVYGRLRIWKDYVRKWSR